jgi:hypothetical protein
MLERIVIGGRELFVQPKVAEAARKRMGEITLRNRKLARELAIAGVMPRVPGNVISPVSKEIVPVPAVVTLDNRAEWIKSKRLNPVPTRTVEDRWLAFLAKNRKALA